MAEKTVKAKETKTVKETAKPKDATKTEEKGSSSEKKCNKGLIIGAIIGAIAIVIAIILIIVFVVIKPFSKNMVGKYELTGLITDGKDQSSSLDLMKAFGITMEVEVTDDKNGKLIVYGQDVNFTYDNDKLHFDIKEDLSNEESGLEITNDFKKDADYTYKDEKITIKTNGSEMVFSKKKENQ